ncbi:MAG: hypothetical protein JWL87_201 [Candidatus Adlerbacteria bacterium]|nr:hypothetical protein [Candidatus Adlerbacteria bacterium]
MGPFRTDVFRGLRYWPVGMIGGITDTAVVFACLYIWGRSRGVEASLAGAAVGYSISFLGHRFITFGAQYTPLWRQLPLFVFLKSPNLAARVFIFHELVVENKLSSSIVLVIPIFFWNFGMKRWIFTGRAPWQKAV